MSLTDEINRKRKEIVVDSYPMSIGEIVSLYNDGELDVHPEFQRVYRWDDDQKTKLIESILLGIPIPPIFVSQRIDGKWDVIDGQQRLSSVLQFRHVLKNEKGELYDALTLKGTKFLPSLEGVKWDDDEKFSEQQRITFKREKLHFTIIKETKESVNAKYEMFQRLNTFGSHLSAQELRNCLLIMINRDLYERIAKLRDDKSFQECLPLAENKTSQAFDMELVVRFLLYVSFQEKKLAQVEMKLGMDEFLTDELEKYANNVDALTDLQNVEKQFSSIFSLLNDVLGESSFKKYQESRFKGPVLLSAFESIIPGLYDNLDYWRKNPEKLKQKVQLLYSQGQYLKAVGKGVRALDRMVQLIRFSREWFKNEN